MMFGPHGGAEPPAILVAWCGATNAWRATAVISADGAPIHVNGPTNSHGATPSAALDELLARRFCCLADQDCPTTIVSVEQLDLPS